MQHVRFVLYRTWLQLYCPSRDRLPHDVPVPGKAGAVCRYAHADAQMQVEI